MHTQAFQRKATRQTVKTSLKTSAVYVVAVVSVLWGLPDRAWSFSSHSVVAVTLFGLWRYSWQLLHCYRSYRYRKSVFPSLRAAADAVANPMPKRLYIMIPSYKEEYRVSRMVFQALVREVRELPCDVFFVVSVSGSDEAAFISRVVNEEPGGGKLHLTFMYQKDGKRMAMGHALRAIARDYNGLGGWHVDSDNDLVVFMDGDTLLLPDTLKKCLPFFKSNPRLGALTTDNLPLQEGEDSIFKDWYALKFIQRHHLFNSHSMSKRVLTVTGRFSIYKASVVLTEEFIRFVEADHLQSWMFGRIRFLMGDDKSTWFYLLKNGYEMFYVPDAPVVAIEARQERFIATSISLMTRWYGNMLRNNARAIQLGPKPMGRFIWWCIIDQRLTVWTPLVGPSSALMLAIFASPYYLVYYCCWVVVTRLTLFWAYVLQGFELRIPHLPLMLYNQWVGAAIKIFSVYNLDVQVWQKTKSAKQKAGGQNLGMHEVRSYFKKWMIAVNVLLLLFLSGLGNGALEVTPIVRSLFWDVHAFASGKEHLSEIVLAVQTGDDAGKAIMQAIKETAFSESIRIVIPAGRFYVDTPVRITRSNVTLAGSGIEATVLVSRLRSEDSAVVAVAGSRGAKVTDLSEEYQKGDKVLRARTANLQTEMPVWISTPNDETFFNSINAVHWRRQYPYLRQYIGVVSEKGEDGFVLSEMPKTSFPSGAKVYEPYMPQHVTLSDFTIQQDVSGMNRSEVVAVYENVVPEYAVDGIQFKWARNCTVENVKVLMAGRHPLALDSCLQIAIRNIYIDGAWNKGKKGNGYVRIARSFYCTITDSVIKNIRHLAFQWSSADNVVSDSVIETDVNFHGGFSQHNSVRNSQIHPPAGHPWGEVTRMPEGGAAYAPPDGDGNIVLESR